MKKLCSVALVVVMLLSALTACTTNTASTPPTTASGEQTASQTTSQPTSQATSAETAAATAADSTAKLPHTPAYEGERPTLKVYWDAAWFTNTGTNWPTDIMKAVCDYTNLDLQFSIWENKDQMAMDIASGELSDIIEVPGNYVPQLLDAKLMVAMDDYLNYAPLLTSVSKLRESVMRKSYSNGDGHWYFWTPNVGLDTPVSSWFLAGGYSVRWDIYTKMGYPEIKTEDDYVAFLKAAVEKYPKTDGGLQTYGYGLYVEDSLYPFWVSGGVYGYVNYGGNMFYNTKGTDIVNGLTDVDGPIWKWIHFCFKANQAGVFDPDSFTMTSEDVNVKVNNGQYFASFNGGNIYDLEKAKDPNTLMGYKSIPVDGLATWGNMINYIGPGFFYGITTTCKNIPAAMTFFNFMNSEDGNRLMMTGVQGVIWDYNSEGKPVILQSAIDRQNTLTGDDASKAFNTFWNCVSGISNAQPLSDGGLGNLWGAPEMQVSSLSPLSKAYCEHYGVSYPNEVFVNMIKEGKSWDCSKIYYDASSLIGTVPDEITMIDTNTKQILVRSVPDLILAKDQAAYDAVQAKVIADIKAADVQKAIDWWNATYQAAVTFIDANR